MALYFKSPSLKREGFFVLYLRGLKDYMIEKLNIFWLGLKKAIGITILMIFFIFLLVYSGLIIGLTKYDPLPFSITIVTVPTFLYGIVLIFFFKKKEKGLLAIVASIFNICFWACVASAL